MKCIHDQFDQEMMVMADGYCVQCLLAKIKDLERISALTENQSTAWCFLVAELIIDAGLTSKEPGDVALEQVLHFLRRKIGYKASEPEALATIIKKRKT